MISRIREFFPARRIVKPGPKPKPFDVKRLEDFRGHRKHAQGIQVSPTRFEPPMKLTGLARREWNRLLASAFWLRETEAAAIADRCLCVQRVQEAETDIRKRGMIVRGSESDGPNPCVRIARAYRASLHRWDAELGLTPSSRASLQLP